MIRTPPVFRIFISSTFGDLKIERDALQQRVFPRLRELCAQYGARFQAIDLRWGVSEQASLDQQTMPICLREIARCQQVTPRPNFVILLGDRYGWRPLPAEIPAREFDQIGSWVVDPAERKLLTTWYKRDDNAVPPLYCLQLRTGIFEDYDTWAEQVEHPLRDIILRAIHQMALTPEERLKYEASATEQEIVHGALQVEDAREHVFCFLRKIARLPRDRRAAVFRDLDERGKPDKNAKEQLRRLKSHLRKHLPDNVYEYKVKWKGDGIATDHLDRLCRDVYDRLANVILAELARMEAIDSLEEEVAEHTAFGLERRRSFTGRTATLQSIGSYLGRTDIHPLALVGEPGSGKTALLAEAAHRTRAEQPGAEVIVRFIGATPASSNGRTLLDGLCRQISRRYGVTESTIPGDYRELIEEFPKRLALASAAKPLILFLDGLDQLSDADNARNLIWLPAELTEYVRVIVSTLPGEQLGVLEGKLPAGNVIQLGLMSGEEGEVLLDRWLAGVGRCLQPPQRAHVLSKFADNGLPLYLKLAFEEARRWKSYTPLAELAPVIPGIIRALFARLASDAHHGQALVAQGLGYLAAARNGLIEDELLDLLSADHTVMDDFRRRSPRSPAVDRLPVVVWSRLYFDLEPYLTFQRTDGTTTLTFYHPTSFGLAVESVYLSDGQKRERHRTLARYFDAQPNQHTGPDGVPRPTLRKLAELPYQQAHAGLWDALQTTLTDFGFLQTKVGATGPRSVVDDYDEALRCGYEGESLVPLQDALRLSAHVTAEDPNQLAGQLTGRLLPDASPAIHALLGQVRQWDEVPWLRPLLPTLMPTGGPLLGTLRGHTDWVEAVAVTPDGRQVISAADDMTLKVWDLQLAEELFTLSGHTHDVRDVAVTPDGRYAVSASADATLKVWDLRRHAERHTLAGHQGEVTAVAVTPDGRCIVSGSADGVLKIWLVDGGDLLQTLSGHDDWIRAVAVTPDGRWVVSASDDERLKVWDLRQGVVLRELLGHTGRVNDVALTPDGRLAVSASAAADKRLMVWDLETGALLRTLTGHGDWVRCVAVMPDGRRAISGSDDQTLRIWDLESGLALRTLAAHTEGVWGVAVTPDGRRLISASGDQTLKVWDPERDAQQRPLLGHPDWGVSGLAVIADGRQVISASGDGTLKVWDLDEGKERHTLSGHSEGVNAVVVTPDGKHAISASSDNTLKVWDLTRGKEIHTLAAHTGRVNDVAVTPDGRWVVSASHDQSLSIWDLERGEEVRSLVGHSEDVTAVGVTPDGKIALSASWEGRVILWDLERGRKLQMYSGRSQGVRALALTADGKQFVVAGEGETLQLFDLRTGELERTLPGHAGTVWRVAVAPNGRYLVSASEDRTLKVWDLVDGRVIATFTGESPMRACAVAPDGRTVFAGEERSRIHFLRLQRGDGAYD